MNIEDICRRAKAEGLSYGQYVLKHKIELAGKRPTSKVQRGEGFCKNCGRGFEPTNSRHVFCGDSCRSAWNQKKHRGTLP